MNQKPDKQQIRFIKPSKQLLEKTSKTDKILAKLYKDNLKNNRNEKNIAIARVLSF